MNAARHQAWHSAPLRLFLHALSALALCAGPQGVLAAEGESASSGAPPHAALSLAATLSAEGLHESAAAEYRRTALATNASCARAALLWTAGYEYLRAERLEQAEKMLAESESICFEFQPEISLLRSEVALRAARDAEAEYYLQSVAAHPDTGGDARAFAARRLAAIRIRRADAAGARQALQSVPDPGARLDAAVSRYQESGTKSPWIGGCLGGLVPGLGYAYSGEYANALRSFLLNGVFIFGLVDTAGDAEWGAFAVIAFFEATWYSGSIYGGVDAAHRWNARSAGDCCDVLEGRMRLEPDRAVLPLARLKFEF